MRAASKPPIVRLPPKSNVEIMLAHAAQVAMIVIGLVVFVAALKAGKYVLAPVAMAIVIGLMLSPVAVFLERRGVPPGLSALAVLVIVLIAIGGLALAIAAPLSFWIDRIPQIWSELQLQISQFKQPLQALQRLRDEIRDATGGPNLTVALDEGSPVASMATFAPAFLGQILLFFAGLYFFVATRRQTQAAILSVCLTRRLRWRVAHIFRDVERTVSTYLLSITVINIGLGLAVTGALWLADVPSPALWGAFAGILNFVIYIGAGLMAVILFAVGLATFDTLLGSLVPPAIYLALNMIESEFVTPMVIGRTMAMNPFVIFLALAFWLWLWGPIGGFIAIPALLILYAAARNILPGTDWTIEALPKL